MRYLHLMALVFALHLGLANGQEPARSSQLLGVWDVVALQDDGKHVNLDGLSIRLEFTNSELILRVSEHGLLNAKEPSQIYEFAVHGKGPVRELDLISSGDGSGPEAGIRIQGICRIQGKKLLICYADADDEGKRGQRPDKFESTSKARTKLYTLNRVISG